ncbi:MAG: homoserine O-acetyltransferase [Oscillatoria princeps RMCB-10]|jgi:homoserine O-acetyltransferase|nr:homoserine O-acetyltransferase [Oscillatoria princeps RMCB-10]
MNYNWFISPETEYYELSEPLLLESGKVLTGAQIGYRTWGNLNPAGDNAVLVCHALTGSADADSWWEPLFGAGSALDPETDFIICSNILGSCYGTTGPASVNPATGCPYGPDFPAITIRDMVRLQAALVRALEIQRLKMVIGGSLGGMQVLEWALLYPELADSIVVIAAPGYHSAWCIGISEAQRQAIYADPNWRGGFYTIDRPPAAGLGAARMMAISTYRSRASFEKKFSRQTREDGRWQIASYLHHHGEKLVSRFDANSYITLTKAMDSHDLGRGRGDYESALRSISQPALVVAIDSDVLYPPEEQEEIAHFIPNSVFRTLHSPDGHDAFLIDMETVSDMIVSFRKQLVKSRTQQLPAVPRFKNRSPWL